MMPAKQNRCGAIVQYLNGRMLWTCGDPVLMRADQGDSENLGSPRVPVVRKGTTTCRLMQHQAALECQKGCSDMQTIAHLFSVLSSGPAVIGVVRVHSLLVTACLRIVRLHEVSE